MSASSEEQIHPRSIITEDDGPIVVCPVCGQQCTHVTEVFTRLGSDGHENQVYKGTVQKGYSSWRRSALVVVFSCEDGHSWELVIQQDKGNNFVEVNRMADDPEMT